MGSKKGLKWPSFDQVLSALQRQSLPLRRLMSDLGLPPSASAGFRQELEKMIRAKQIVRLRGGVYTLPRGVKTLEGRLVQPQPGFGFVIPETGGEDLYISATDMKDALPGDLVSARILSPDRGGRRRGQIMRVLERARKQIVGLFRQEHGAGLIKPKGLPFVREFFVAPQDQGAARDGEQVVAEVTAWPEAYTQGRARVTEVLGAPDMPGMDITVLVRRFELPEFFSKAAQAEAQSLAQEPGPLECQNRIDLRNERIVTIDGADARDFDDAVSASDRPGGGWRLGVHIADVSHYLREESSLDLEARDRGTSVYLPDRVLHMLPEELSCGVCSLVPDRDRLTVSAFIDVEPDGTIAHTAFGRSVIHSQGRLTYEGVEPVLAGQKSGTAADDFAPELHRLHRIAQALRQQRNARGNLDFDLPDPKVVLGPDGRVQTIEKRVQLASHRLIEDCMIAANEAVAAYLLRTSTPALYRIHEPPDGDKFQEFKLFLHAYGYRLELGKTQDLSRAYQRLLLSWQGKPEAAVLNMALLRSMKLAVYAPENKGHFGLGSACYTHFTSPIRRYPDLIVHRMLTERLAAGTGLSGRRRAHLIGRMPEWGEFLSGRERRAEKAEREAVKIKQAEFMESRIGEVCRGTITSVTHFGFFVELEEHFVEGLVRSADLAGDYFIFDERQRYLRGANTGLEYRTGDSVTVKVTQVDRELFRVIFTLHEEGRTVAPAPPRRNPPRVAAAKPKRRTGRR